jgi:acyl-coenzyme A synthetase/AMP-(fatty) acid ligase
LSPRNRLALIAGPPCAISNRRSRRLAAALQSAGVVPGDFVTVKELPYTATGKLLKTKLRQDFSNWEWDSPMKPATISAN